MRRRDFDRGCPGLELLPSGPSRSGGRAAPGVGKPARARRRAGAAAIAAVLALAPACTLFTTVEAGNQMRADIDALRDDVEVQRERLTAEADRMVALVAEVERRMDELRAFLERTAEVLARTNADFAADFEEWQSEYRRLRGRVDELADAFRTTATALAVGEALGRRVERLERYAGIDPEVDPATVPADADGLWDLASALAAGEDHPRARAHFRLFLSRHPDDARVLRARIEIGAAYAREGRHADAVAVFSELSPAERDGPEGDRVYFHTAQALAGLGRCDDARTLLAALDQRYPDSPLRPAAEQLRTEMTTMPQCPRPAASTRTRSNPRR